MPAWLPRERRLTFGDVAELYEEVRPSYPPELVEEVLAYASPKTSAKPILEVGAGTGKATRLFAATGDRIVALEPSPAMAAVARRICAPYRSITIVESDFEHWSIPAAAFRLLISAQAWHWIDPAMRYGKARAALHRGGALAVFWNRPDWPSCPLREVLDETYRDAAPSFTPSGPMHPRTAFGELVPDWQAEVARAQGFEHGETRTYTWDYEYLPHEYVSLLSTHSDHIVLDPATRARLFDRVAAAIANHGGKLQMTYITQLCLARAA
jgi:SAM-dependent methyltransferase